MQISVLYYKNSCGFGFLRFIQGHARFLSSTVGASKAISYCVGGRDVPAQSLQAVLGGAGDLPHSCE